MTRLLPDGTHHRDGEKKEGLDFLFRNIWGMGDNGIDPLEECVMGCRHLSRAESVKLCYSRGIVDLHSNKIDAVGGVPGRDC
jgi:hypothetical protein